MKVSNYQLPHLRRTMIESPGRAQHDGVDGQRGERLVSKILPFSNFYRLGG
jgi:hypothetical protein